VIIADLLGSDFIPGANVAFLLSFVITVALSLVVIPYAKRRPVGTPLSWGEAMAASAYVFFVFFLAYGVVPHQWLTHADNELAWRKDVTVWGPAGIVRPQAQGGWFPFTINAVHVRDIFATLIYVIFLGLNLWLWAFWQKRGAVKKAEIAVSTYGRPLARKA
jgi:hypothetical protein